MRTSSARGSIELKCAVLVVALAAPAAGQATTRVSLDSLGAQGDSGSFFPSLSADGRYVAFQSYASNLVGGDTNNCADVFVRDRVSGATERVSVDSLGVQGNAHSYTTSISADGRYVAFYSDASNLVGGDTNGWKDVFVRDRVLGTTERVSVDSLGAQGNNDSWYPSISADGRYVAFHSLASNLVSGDTNGWPDVFVHDRVSGATERVSVSSLGVQGNNNSLEPSISSDGRYVAFLSYASNLVPGDTGNIIDIFVRDRSSGTTERVSVSSVGTQGNGHSYSPSISADGRYVAFFSFSTNLVVFDTNDLFDVFVRDRVAGTTERVSVDSNEFQAANASLYPSISADGRYVVFESYAYNLVPGDTNAARDIFVRDRVNGTTERASLDTAGTQGNDTSYGAVISADGRCVAFDSTATNLASDDTNGVDDVFVRILHESGSTFCSPGEAGILACPCAPGTDAPHDAGHGCSNSGHTAGGLLVGTGAPVAGAGTDTLVLTASDIGSGLTIFIEGSSASSGVAFGDGVRCVAGTLTRFGTTIASSRTAAYPDDAGDPPISVFTGARAGETRYYQVYYRSAAAWCNAATFNITNGCAIVWQ